MEPLAIQPKEPPAFALSSLNCSATLSNRSPFLIRSCASSILLCFSHKICRTLTALAGFNLSPLPPLSPSSVGAFDFAGAAFPFGPIVRLREESSRRRLRDCEKSLPGQNRSATARMRSEYRWSKVQVFVAGCGLPKPKDTKLKKQCVSSGDM